MIAAATRVRLPPGRHFALTWSIPDDFGGMTEAMLRRSHAFDRLGGVAVDVLTFDDRPDYPALESMLRRRGALSSGMRIVNLYDWLREHPLATHRDEGATGAFRPLQDGPDVEVRTRDGIPVSRARRGAHGTVLQVDHLRADGTVVVSDRRDVRREGVIGGRSVVLCDRAGHPLRSWSTVRGLYTAWLDELTNGSSSFMIIDSKTVARFMLTYRRRHVITVHLVHGSHRGEAGDIRASRREALTNAHAFDVVAVLSARQARDLRRVVGPMPNLEVVRNGRGAAPDRTARGAAPDRTSPDGAPSHVARPDRTPSVIARERGRGIVVASLNRRKRVSHAIDAVRTAKGRGGSAVTLEVYGDGPSRDALARRVGDDPRIRLRGHDPDVRERLREASFLLLTSHSEGFPLTLVEAMAAGCVPIAYDVEYGPGDLIRSGRNGFLVPPGDIDALARTIGAFMELPEGDVRAMRRRAVRTAGRFDDARVTHRWATLLESARLRRDLRARASPRARAAAASSPAVQAIATTALDVVAGIGRRLPSRG